MITIVHARGKWPAGADVQHHILAPRAFFDEAIRCLKAGGVIAMIEPWFTLWSRFVYCHLHHESCPSEARRRELPATGALSGANGARHESYSHISGWDRRSPRDFRKLLDIIRICALE